MPGSTRHPRTRHKAYQKVSPHANPRRAKHGRNPLKLVAQEFVGQIAHAVAQLAHRKREFARQFLNVAVEALLELEHAASIVFRIVEHSREMP